MTTKRSLKAGERSYSYFALETVLSADEVRALPYVVRLLLENVARNAALGRAGRDDVDAVLAFRRSRQPREFAYFPARVLLQDLTGVPVIVDLAAMRSAVVATGAEAAKVNPVTPTDLVIDHSVQVDFFGSPVALGSNVGLEIERNRERYTFLRWAQQEFDNLRVVPPGAGIVHQVNLEYLAQVVVARDVGGELTAFPDTVVGTDSHTTMISGAGVLGWGVGGIEAEAAMLGEPIAMVTPRVVGVRLTGRPGPAVTATDIVLAITERLRAHGVVGKFVEYYGPALELLTLPDRATIANMSPEYGATTGFFPVDAQTLAYLRGTGRSAETVELVERYCRTQHLFHEAGEAEAEYEETVEIDLGEVEPSVAGPSRPQDRLSLPAVKGAFRSELAAVRNRAQTASGSDAVSPEVAGQAGPAEAAETAATVEPKKVPVTIDGESSDVGDGSVVIAAITSCTNTSNPSVMLAAGLLARNAVEAGLSVGPTVKTSLAPGSQVVPDYLEAAGLIEPLEKLGFYIVGFGCTTCIGNSGPLPEPVAEAIEEHDLACAAVLSGNRNFEGRIHPLVRMSFLASPPLVVAYAVAGTVDIDLACDPLGAGTNGKPVFLEEIWPKPAELAEAVAGATDPEIYSRRYANISEGSSAWQALDVPAGQLYKWDPASTYIAEPPFLKGLELSPAEPEGVAGARVLAYLGDSVTTDHISPAGTIHPDSPAGRWLAGRGVGPAALHSYGARRGNHEVMMRGTFANVRLRNKLLPGVEGGFTAHLPDGDEMPIYDASVRYRDEGVPLVILAGKEYGSGSSRDWAAKGTQLLGVRAVIAESFERIHRSNLVQMGLLPLEFPAGSSAESLGLTGREVYEIDGIGAGMRPGSTARVKAAAEDGSVVEFDALVRIDSDTELGYYWNGGILPMVVRKVAAG